jgi:Skp family chaperone for outer membrane proteins
LAFVHRQDIIDWAMLYGYTPPAQVATIATQDTMTNKARRILYVNHPEIQTSAPFAKSCSQVQHEEKTIVLGCYTGNQSGIYVLSVNDPRLDGVEQVTTAHEMLHAAYDRLSSSERAKVDAMLMDYYNHDLHDERLQSTIDAYKKSEPNDVVNEMHSIFGTEIAALPTPLEQYYAQYFTNRHQVTAFAADYQSEFTGRQKQVATYDAQLKTMKAQIDADNADLDRRDAQINTSKQQLDSLRTNGSASAYNAAVPAYNAQVNAYNDELAAVKRLIAQYNAIVAARNALVLEEQELVGELSGSSAETQTN